MKREVCVRTVGAAEQQRDCERWSRRAIWRFTETASTATSWLNDPTQVCVSDLRTANYNPSTLALQDTALETRSSSRKAAWLHPHGSSALCPHSPRAPCRAPPRFCSDDVIWRGRHRATNADQCVARARANSHALRPRGRREGRAARPPRVQRARSRASPRGTVHEYVVSRRFLFMYAIGFCTRRITQARCAPSRSATGSTACRKRRRRGVSGGQGHVHRSTSHLTASPRLP